MERRQLLKRKSKAIKHTQPMADDASEADESGGQNEKRARIVRRRRLLHRDPLRDVLDFLPVLKLLNLAEVSRLFYRHFWGHRDREAVCGTYQKIEFPGEVNDVKNLAFFTAFRFDFFEQRTRPITIPVKYAAPPEDVKEIAYIQISINNRTHTSHKGRSVFLEIPKGLHEFLAQGLHLFYEHQFTLNLLNISGMDLPILVWGLLQSIQNGFPKVFINFQMAKSFSILSRILTLPWALKSNVLELNFPPPFVPGCLCIGLFVAIVNWLHEKPDDRWEDCGGRQVEIYAHSNNIAPGGQHVMAHFCNLLKQKFLSDTVPRQFKLEMNTRRDPLIGVPQAFRENVTRFESAERNECLEWRMVVDNKVWRNTICLVERKPLSSTTTRSSSSEPTEEWHPKKNFVFTYSEPQ